MSVDILSEVNWNQIMAMSCLALLPRLCCFFTQNYFVEGIFTTGLKE
jgi:oligogalacturonide transport system permease protein